MVKWQPSEEKGTRKAERERRRPGKGRKEEMIWLEKRRGGERKRGKKRGGCQRGRFLILMNAMINNKKGCVVLFYNYICIHHMVFFFLLYRFWNFCLMLISFKL